jgi:hypothetical protein
MHTQPVMPPRLTLREIQARHQRAEEGVARIESLKRQFHAEMMARMDQGGIEMAGIARAERDASWQRRVEEIQREMEEATEMIRGGMPRTSIEVNGWVLVAD